MVEASPSDPESGAPPGVQGVRLELPVQVTVEEETREGTIVALGPAGAAIRLEDPPDPGTRVDLAFSIGPYPLEITGPAEVLYRGAYGEEGFGVSLGQLPSFEQSVIGDYMKRLIEDMSSDKGLK